MIGLGSSGAITQWLKSLLKTFFGLNATSGGGVTFVNGATTLLTVGPTGDVTTNGNLIASGNTVRGPGNFTVGSNGGDTIIQANNSGGKWGCRSGTNELRGYSNSLITWLNTTTSYDTDANVDIGVSRLGTNTIGLIKSNGSAAGGFLQNTGGEAALAANFTNATATLNNTNLSLTVVAGRSYRITGMLQVSNSTSTEGIQLDFNGGSATATTFFVAANAIGSVTPGTLTSTTLAGVINYSVITGTDYIMLSGYLKVNAGGTLVLRFAENSSTLGTATLGAGSWIALNDTVNL